MTSTWPSNPNLQVHKFEWSSLDEGQDFARFTTTVEVTGDDYTEVAPVVLRRLLCFYVISQMTEKSLGEAFDSLSEIYRWQIQQASVPKHSVDVRNVGQSKIRAIERTPFTVRED
jgi:hypothetical protein